MTDRHTDTVNAAVKRKGEEEGGEYESEIRTAMRSLKKNMWSLQTISQNNVSCVKNVKQSVKFCECTKQNILDYPRFSIIRASSPLDLPG
jgi:hypothetical protein